MKWSPFIFIFGILGPLLMPEFGKEYIPHVPLEGENPMAAPPFDFKGEWAGTGRDACTWGFWSLIWR